MQLTGTQIAMIIIVVDFIILLISEILMKKHLTKKIMFPKELFVNGMEQIEMVRSKAEYIALN